MNSNENSRMTRVNHGLVIATFFLAFASIFGAGATLWLASVSKTAVEQASKNTKTYEEALTAFEEAIVKFELSLIKEPMIHSIYVNNQSIPINKKNLYQMSLVENAAFMVVKIKNPGSLRVKINPRIRFFSAQREFFCPCQETSDLSQFETKEFTIELINCIKKNRVESVSYTASIWPTVIMRNP